MKQEILEELGFREVEDGYYTDEGFSNEEGWFISYRDLKKTTLSKLVQDMIRYESAKSHEAGYNSLKRSLQNMLGIPN
jgi:hypothetical protein